jgi:rubrerythrin
MEWNLEDVKIEDLLEMAAIVAQSGFDFYARLSARADELRVKNELKFLRDEEALHKAFFLEQLRERGGAPRGEVAPALKEKLDREFIGPMDRMFASSDIKDNDKTLRFGEDLEQKSIDLYGGMRKALGESQQAALDRIISQEREHCRKLGLIRSYHA